MHNNPLLVTSPNKIVLKCLLSLPNLVLNVLNDAEEQEFEDQVRDLLVPPDLLPVLVSGNDNDDEREVDCVSRWLMNPNTLLFLKWWLHFSPSSMTHVWNPYWAPWEIWSGCYQRRKKFCILHELGNKKQLGVWEHCEPLNGFSRGPGDKALAGLPALFYHLNPGFPCQFLPIFQVFRHHFQVILIQFKNLRTIWTVDNATTPPASSTLFLFIQMKVQILKHSIFSYTSCH